MAETVRFPIIRASIGPGKTLPSEDDQVLVLVSAQDSFPQGGGNNFVALAPWKQIAAGSETPYTDVVIEFMYAGPGTPSSFQIGDGTATTALGLFGEITVPFKGATAPQRFLLGRLGLNQGTVAPTIPIISSTVGFAQEVCSVAVYDKLAIGGINTVVSVTESYPITVRARPIRRRYYGG